MIKTLPTNAGGLGSIPSWGDKIPHASGPKNQNVKQKQCRNKFNKDFKNGLYIKKKILKIIRANYVDGPQFFVVLLSTQFSSVAQSCPTLCDPMD